MKRKEKFEQLILDFRERCLKNDFAEGDSFWIDNYEFEVVTKKEPYEKNKTRKEEDITETCECNGLAKFHHWDKGNAEIPILKCERCGDEFEAHEDYWRTIKKLEQEEKYFEIEVDIKVTKLFTVKAKNKEEAKKKLNELEFEREEEIKIDEFESELIPDDDIKEVEKLKEKSLIKEMEKSLNKRGYVCVGQPYVNGMQSYNFLHKKSGAYILIQEEDLDEEILWSLLVTSYAEIEGKIQERNKGLTFTEEEMENKIGDWEDEDYKAVIRDLIKANEEVIKDE